MKESGCIQGPTDTTTAEISAVTQKGAVVSEKSFTIWWQ